MPLTWSSSIRKPFSPPPPFPIPSAQQQESPPCGWMAFSPILPKEQPEVARDAFYPAAKRRGFNNSMPITQSITRALHQPKGAQHEYQAVRRGGRQRYGRPASP